MWRDLLPLTRGEVVYETLITTPWLAVSLTAWHLASTTHMAFAALAIASAFFFFLTGLRQVHNTYHYALGLGRRSTDLTMFALIAIALTITAAVLLESLPLRAHVMTMIVGQCFTAFFAVWTVHHDCLPIGRIARTQRGWLKNVMSYDMFHHVEHHLFPAVPTCHLPELSNRLDRVASEYKDLMVY